MDSNNKKWRLETIKSVRVSPELYEMLQREIRARHTSFSQYVRYAIIMQMKHGNKPVQNTA